MFCIIKFHNSSFAPDGRRPGRSYNFNNAFFIAANGRLPATLREPIRANPRHQARICGASAMWVRRATQRAEPRAQSGFQGRRAGRLLYAVPNASLELKCADGRRPGAGTNLYTNGLNLPNLQFSNLQLFQIP